MRPNKSGLSGQKKSRKFTKIAGNSNFSSVQATGGLSLAKIPNMKKSIDFSVSSQ
jgi:hypothetical protein